jgi:cytochrome c553
MNRTLLTALTLASLTVSLPAYAAGDVAAGKEKAGACSMCHGPNGEGSPMAPKLAGKSAADIVQAIKDYASGKRDNAIMKSQATSLSAADVDNLAAYYATLK